MNVLWYGNIKVCSWNHSQCKVVAWFGLSHLNATFKCNIYSSVSNTVDFSEKVLLVVWGHEVDKKGGRTHFKHSTAPRVHGIETTYSAWPVRNLLSRQTTSYLSVYILLQKNFEIRAVDFSSVWILRALWLHRCLCGNNFLLLYTDFVFVHAYACRFLSSLPYNYVQTFYLSIGKNWAH